MQKGPGTAVSVPERLPSLRKPAETRPFPSLETDVEAMIAAEEKDEDEGVGVIGAASGIGDSAGKAETCGDEKPSLPPGWVFPKGLSFRSMLHLFLIGVVGEDGGAPIPCLRALSGKEFGHVVRGQKNFKDMCLLLRWVEEVGIANGVWSGETMSITGKGEKRRRWYRRNSGHMWTEEEIETLYEGVKSHFISNSERRMSRLRQNEELSWSTVLRDEQVRRKKATPKAASAKGTSHMEDQDHAL